MIAAFQIDPLDSLKIASDTSILLALELQARGYQIYTYQPNQLGIINNKVIAHGKYVQLYNTEQRSSVAEIKADDFFKIIEEAPIELENASLIMMRQDPPFNMDYITATYLLDLVKDKVLVLNDPTAVRDNVEKLMVYHIPQYLPPSIVSQDITLLEKFMHEHNEVILKPLYGHGGHEIKLIKSQKDFGIVSSFLKKHKHVVMQKFLPQIVGGDTRVAMLKGEILGAIRRIPAEGMIESNLAMGGKAIAHRLTAKEQEICQSVGNLMKQKGIFFAGVDIIQEYLIEINITSPTTIKALNKIYHQKFEEKIIDAVFA